MKAARPRSEGEVSCGNTGIDSNYRSLLEIYQQGGSNFLVSEIERIVDRLEN